MQLREKIIIVLFFCKYIGDNDLICKFCKERQSTSESLEKHILAVHGVVDNEVPENGTADNSKEKITNKDDPEVPENGSADNSISKEEVTNQDDPEVPEVPGSPNLKRMQHKVLILLEKEADQEPQFVQLGRYYEVVDEKVDEDDQISLKKKMTKRTTKVDDLGGQLHALRQKQSKFVTYLEFESSIDWVDVDLENMLERMGTRGKKIIKRLTLDNVQKSETSSSFWEKVFQVAPKVEEIEIGMDGNFEDLPYILSKLHVFKKLKILRVFIKNQELEIEEKKSIIQDAMKQELPKELEASVMEILASFDSKEEETNQNDPEVPGSPNLEKIRHKVLILFKKEANEEPQLVQLGRYYQVVDENVDEDEEISFKRNDKKKMKLASYRITY